MKFFKLLILPLLIFLCSCQSYDNPSSDKIQIVATIFPQYDFSRQICKEFADVSMLLPLGSEVHDYEPTPNDIKKISEADIFIYTGGESDTWIDNILDSIDTSNMKIINLVNICDTYNEEITVGMQSEEDDSEEEEIDEHVWTTPKNANIISAQICSALCSVDTKNAEYYKNNLSEYSSKLSELDNKFKEIRKNSKYDTLIFADRFPFRYFIEEYDFKYYAAFPGCAEETEPSVATVAFLIDTVKENHIPTVFCTEFSSKKLAETISADTGAKISVLNSCHNVSKKDFDNGITYLELMNENANILKEALN